MRIRSLFRFAIQASAGFVTFRTQPYSDALGSRERFVTGQSKGLVNGHVLKIGAIQTFGTLLRVNRRRALTAKVRRAEPDDVADSGGRCVAVEFTGQSEKQSHTGHRRPLAM
jgi:hypothetical protein